MRFGVLGPVQVWTPAGIADVGGARQRRLLAALVLHAGEVASTDRLLDIVFEGAPPSGASTTIRTYVARLRKSLGDAEAGAEQLITTEQGGYRLQIDLDAIDSARFEASIETARGQFDDRDPIGAAATLREGLAMWRGAAFGEFTFEEWARPEASRLEELKTVAEEELNEALLACGLAHDVVSATRAQIQEHPLREELRGQHMLALYRAGRQVEALRSLEEFQRVLVDVGLEPSEDLLRLGRSIASHDPALRLESPAGQPLRGYRVGAGLGRGAHGVVYRAVQPGVGREVAIKTIRAQLADDPEFIRRFDAEAQLVANLEHPHVVPIYDYWREPGGAYIVMRLLSDNLGSRLAAGPMAVPAVAATARELGGALAAAHRAGVVHGDIKPSNVLVDESSTYLADFGVATLVESASGDETTYPSSGYESPELLAGEPPSPASDQFALAVLLIQLLTGQLPFGTRAIATPHDRAPSVHVQRPSVPAPVDDVLRKATAWDATDRYADVDSFVEHLDAALAGQGAPTPRDRQLANPYRGLRAFSEIDRAVFFGRDALVDELVGCLEGPAPDDRLLVVVGASGSGKSSAVRAGLIPRVRSGAVPGSEHWLIATMQPGQDPFGELEAALRSVAATDPPQRAGATDESDVIRLLDAAVPPTQPLLLVIDQFEELFTQVSEEATTRHFITGLTRAVRRPDGNLRVVATLRADHLDRPLRYSDFGQLVKRGAVPIVGMSATELASAVTRPAAGVGIEIEPALATQLVADVLDQPAALPLLQFTLTELFERRTGPVLTLAGYRGLGGVDAAVAGRAEAVLGRLTDAQRELARRMFLRLVTVDASGSVSRRRALRSDLLSVVEEPGSMDGVVDAFGRSRLLTFDRDPHSREPTVELAHEALIDQWPRFGGWVADAGAGLRIRDQLAEAAHTWDQLGRDDGDLYRGLRLEGAMEWAGAQPDALSLLEGEFLARSAGARAEEIEAERAQAERDRRTNRRLRGLLAGVGLLLVIALVAGALAVRQQRRAERQTEVAVAAVADADLATLISRSAAQSAENAELSVLLALEAHRRSPGRETEQAVLNALGSSGIPNRVASISGLDNGDCRPIPTFVGSDGMWEHAVVDGRLASLDLGTGDAGDHGPAPEDCGAWLGDPATGRVVVSSADAERIWVGSFEDPYAIRVEQDSAMYLLDSDPATGVVAFVDPRGGNEAVILVDVVTGERIAGPIGEGTLWAVGVDPSGSFAAVSHRERDTADRGRLRVLDVPTGEERFRLDTTATATSLTFDPETRELIVGTADGALMTVDPVTGEVTSTVATSATSLVIAVGVRDDGRIVAVTEGQIELVDRRTGSAGAPTELTDVVVARVRPDGTVVTRGADGTYDVIELGGNALVERSWPVDPFARVAFNAGRAGVFTLEGQVLSIVDLATGQQRGLDLRNGEGAPVVVDGVYPERDGVWALAFAGFAARWEGDRLVERIDFPGRLVAWTRSGDLIAVLHRDADGRQVASLVDLEHDAAGIVFTVPAPDGSSVHPALGGGLHVYDRDGALHSYDADGEPTGVIDTGARETFINTMDPTTGVLAVDGGPSGGVVVVDPASGDVQQVPGNDAVANLGFAQEGRLLVITGFDGTVRIWDLERSESAGLAWNGTGVGPSSPSWYDPSSDSIWVYTSGRLLEVPLDPQRWVERACEIVGRDLTPEERDRYVPGADDATDRAGGSRLAGASAPRAACA